MGKRVKIVAEIERLAANEECGNRKLKERTTSAAAADKCGTAASRFSERRAS